MARHLPIVEMRSSVRNDGTRATVHPADVRGRFATARRVVFWALLALYAAVPWITINGHPAVQIDLLRRRFYLLGSVFNAQDFWLMFFLLTGIGFSLITVTTVLGRVWCGWGCPQTVFLEGLFRPFQRWIEGPRDVRLRREQHGWTFDRTWRRVLLWSIYAVLAWVVAHILLGYFLPIRSLLRVIDEGPGAHPEAFGITMFFTGVMFFDFAWFREQLCMVICPYGRLQSALTDPDSLVVGYDAKRGEPRGKAKEKDAGAAGDCVDCNRCVVVCPTGIDIRNGLQLDCVACTACIDACDDVMDKLGRPRGLVRYDSWNGLHHEPRRYFRPRLAFYAVLGVVGLVAVTLATRARTRYEANVLRLTGAPYTLDGGTVRNAYNIHLVNKRNVRTTFHLAPEAASCPRCEFLMPLASVTLEPFGSAFAPVFVSLPVGDYRGDQTVRMTVHPDGAERDDRTVSAPFLGPSR